MNAECNTPFNEFDSHHFDSIQIIREKKKRNEALSYALAFFVTMFQLLFPFIFHFDLCLYVHRSDFSFVSSVGLFDCGHFKCSVFTVTMHCIANALMRSESDGCHLSKIGCFLLLRYRASYMCAKNNNNKKSSVSSDGCECISVID